MVDCNDDATPVSTSILAERSIGKKKAKAGRNFMAAPTAVAASSASMGEELHKMMAEYSSIGCRVLIVGLDGLSWVCQDFIL
jgi:hypothetical protein